MPKVKSYVQLLNGCYRTDIAVHPTNWDTKSAKIFKGGKAVEWFIWYRFYDPAYRDKYPHGKPIKIRGMNKFKDLAQRQAHTRDLLELEHDLIDVKHYNPITKASIQAPTEAQPKPQAIPADDRSLSTQQYLQLLKSIVPEPSTPFIPALWIGLSRVQGVPGTINDMGSIIRGTEDAAKLLTVEVDGKTVRLDMVQIQQVRKKHIRLILEKCAQINQRWSNNRHNRYRAYLQMIFKPLVTLEAIEMNPVNEIETLTKTENVREVLTPEQRRQINDHLYCNHYPFWRFMQIFFHSGARETELMQVRESDVDLANQRYKVLIRKGKVYRWVWKAIKDIAVPFWQEVLDECRKLKESQLTNLEVRALRKHNGKIRLIIKAGNTEGATHFNVGYREPGKRDRYTFMRVNPLTLPVSIDNLPDAVYDVKVTKYCRGYMCLPVVASSNSVAVSNGEIYLFSRNLRIGYESIRPDQVSRRWDKYVKDKETGLGIDVDFYSLKHLNTTEMMDFLSSGNAHIEEAEREVAELNSQTTPDMVKGVYDVKNEERKRNRVKSVKNTFA
jgi:hypothetical protein